jgi:SAM-dependent methyltransferase
MAERHRHELAAHGPSLGAVGWSLQSQRKRFEVLAELGPMANARVLDVGCGFGDFLAFLQEAGQIPASYAGIDVVAEFIDEARRRYPDACFNVADLIDLPGENIYDYCVASGIFYLPSSRWNKYVRETTLKMLAISEKGVAINFLSSFSRRPDGTSYYADPGAVLRLLGQHVCSRLVLRHDYLPNDFTIYLYKAQ